MIGGPLGPSTITSSGRVAEAGGAGLEVALLGEARGAPGGVPEGGAGGLAVAGHLEQMGPHRREPMVVDHAIVAVEGGEQVESRGRGVLSVPVDDARTLGTVVRRLEEAGIDVIELSLHLPSLDEVFFTLTRGTDNKQEVTV